MKLPSFSTIALITGVPTATAHTQQPPAAPIRLAIFEFELEDTSAGAESGETASDATGLVIYFATEGLLLLRAEISGRQYQAFTNPQ
jgi:hypothetical protein